MKFKELGQIIKDFIEGTYSNYISADYKTSTKKPIETEKKIDSVVPVDNTVPVDNSVVPTTSTPRKELDYTNKTVQKIQDSSTVGPSTPAKSVPVTSDGKAARNETSKPVETQITGDIVEIEVD